MPPQSDRDVGRWEQHFDRFMLRLGWMGRAKSGAPRPRGLFAILDLAERMVTSRHHLRAVRPGSLTRIEVAPLGARPLPLDGQPTVRRGESVLVLHMDNQVAASLAGSIDDDQAYTWRLARLATQDLRALAQLFREGAFPPGVRVAWSESMFYSFLERYGFATRPARRTLRTPLARLFLLGMTEIYGHSALSGAGGDRRFSRRLGEAWISIDALMARFPARSAHAPHPPHEDTGEAGADSAAGK